MSGVPGYFPANKLHPVLRALREFFYSEGYKESFPQTRRHILPACEDERTIALYEMTGQKLPLPQTEQMGLEDDVLGTPSLEKVFCLTASYRDEPNPKPRHDLTFPLFEFESLGNYIDLLKTSTRLLRFLGYTGDVVTVDYDIVAMRYGVDILDHDHEERMLNDYGPAVLLTRFPLEETYWNMKACDDGRHAFKMDAILGGIETFGTAERETSVEKMRSQFKTVSDGKYAEKLYQEFGEERVHADLERYLGHNFVERFGGGIGVTRLIKFLEGQGLMEGLVVRYG